MSEEYGRRVGIGTGGGAGKFSKRSSVRRIAKSRGRSGKGSMQKQRRNQQGLQRGLQGGMPPVSPMAEAFDAGLSSGYEDLSSGYESDYESEEGGIMPGSGLDIDALAEQVSEQVVQEGIFAGLDDDELDTEDIFGDLGPAEYALKIHGSPRLSARAARRAAEKRAHAQAENTRDAKLARIDDEIEEILDGPSGELQIHRLLKAYERRDLIAYSDDLDESFGAVPHHAYQQHHFVGRDQLDRMIEDLMRQRPSREVTKRLVRLMELRAALVSRGLRGVDMSKGLFDAWDNLHSSKEILERAQGILRRNPGASLSPSDRSSVQQNIDLAQVGIAKAETFLLTAETGRPVSYGAVGPERYGEDSSKPGTFVESFKMGAGLGLGFVTVVGGIGLIAKAAS